MSDHLLDTAIGGVIALAGTFVAQWFGLFSSRVERQEKHAARQRERLERISDCIAECVEWSQRIMNATTIAGVSDTRIPKDARRAVMLVKIYFPDLVEPSTEYVNELLRYQMLALSSFRSDAPPGVTIGAQMHLSPASKEYELRQLSLRNRLDEAIAKEARKYEPST